MPTWMKPSIQPGGPGYDALTSRAKPRHVSNHFQFNTTIPLAGPGKRVSRQLFGYDDRVMLVKGNLRKTPSVPCMPILTAR